MEHILLLPSINMSRKKQALSNLNPYHMTGRCHNREYFPIALDQVWDILSEQLYFISHGFNIKIHAFVLMSNHFHLLATAPDSNMSDAMGWFMRESARTINFQAQRINQLWGQRFFRSEIQNQHYYKSVYKYLYRNPIEVSLANRVVDYPYSTIQGLLGIERPTIPVYDQLLIDSPGKILDWIDQKPSEEYLNYIRTGLRKSVFELPKVNSRKNPLETELL